MRIFAFIISITFLITLLSEFYLKLKGFGDPIRYDSNLLYGYSPKINQIKNRLNDAKVTINERGLRTIYSWNGKEKNKIIFLGDSVTYGGSYIDDTKLFSHIVCQKIKDFLCGNAGVNAYGVYNVVMRSTFDERLQDGNIFVYVFSPDDFLRDYRNSNTAHFYLNDKKFFLPALTEAINFFSSRYNIAKLISKKNDTISNYNDNINFIKYSIKNLKNEIKKKRNNGKEVIVILSNTKNDKTLKSKINNLIKKELSDQINIYTLIDVLNKDDYFYDESVHLSTVGHKIVANEIVRILKKENLVNTN